MAIIGVVNSSFPKYHPKSCLFTNNECCNGFPLRMSGGEKPKVCVCKVLYHAYAPGKCLVHL